MFLICQRPIRFFLISPRLFSVRSFLRRTLIPFLTLSFSVFISRTSCIKHFKSFSFPLWVQFAFLPGTRLCIPLLNVRVFLVSTLTALVKSRCVLGNNDTITYAYIIIYVTTSWNRNKKKCMLRPRPNKRLKYENRLRIPVQYDTCYTIYRFDMSKRCNEEEKKNLFTVRVRHNWKSFIYVIYAACRIDFRQSAFSPVSAPGEPRVYANSIRYHLTRVFRITRNTRNKFP